VYNNATIDNIIELCPETLEDLLNVKGFGPVKVEKYGKDIIEICANNMILPGFSSKEPKPTKSTISPKHMKKIAKEDILACYHEGKTINEIAQMRQVTKETVENQMLSIYQTEDIDIDPDYFGLTEDYENEIKEVVARIGSKYIKPIKDAINTNISYSQIKLCLLIIDIEKEE
jgi:ATP-dependent DNA helicase RecQ